MLECHLEKVVHDFSVNIDFEFGEPFEFEFFGLDPAEVHEFVGVLVHVHVAALFGELAQEVGLFLAVVTVFAAFFCPDFFRIEVAVTSALIEDLVAFWGESDFFANFAIEGFLQALAGVHAALGELPRTRLTSALAD